jgi:hypothetical protein
MHHSFRTDFPSFHRQKCAVLNISVGMSNLEYTTIWEKEVTRLIRSLPISTAEVYWLLHKICQGIHTCISRWAMLSACGGLWLTASCLVRLKLSRRSSIGTSAFSFLPLFTGVTTVAVCETYSTLSSASGTLTCSWKQKKLIYKKRQNG